MRASFGAVAVGITATLAAGGTAVAAARPAPASTVPASTAAAAVKVHQIPVGGHPGGVAVDQKRGIAWAATGTNLIKISEATQRRIARLPFDASLVKVDPAKDIVVAADTARSRIVEISERTDKIVASFAGGATIEGLALDTTTHTIWYSAGGSVFELNEANGHLIHSVPVESGNPFKFPASLAVDSDRGLVWVCVDGDGRNPPNGLLAEIKESAHRVTKRIDLGASACSVAVDATKGTVWEGEGGTIARIINEKTGHAKILLNVPNNSDGVAIDTRAQIVVFANNISGANNVVLVSEKTQRVTSTVKLGFFPISVAVDPVTGNVYVPIAFRGVISEFHLP